MQTQGQFAQVAAKCISSDSIEPDALIAAIVEAVERGDTVFLAEAASAAIAHVDSLLN
ncbi:hypothetical protein LV780_17055 [Cereibacter azotoformans]|uniref:Uncharacterized protein n=1 Tax=Cereibacter azotoformans TaxID=43057 RepID=A0A2T5JPU2_9RHOB|nr:hypothetical protein [Cereibacter azotoformans]PTR09679.1 hypothetical protein C8J28_1322 [Cereibacter azotoformans]UIJ32825.1 hypothetical protein LV780_17055 [Cereibacter azotoformans]